MTEAVWRVEMTEIARALQMAVLLAYDLVVKTVAMLAVEKAGRSAVEKAVSLESSTAAVMAAMWEKNMVAMTVVC